MPKAAAMNAIPPWIAVAQSATPALADDVAAAVPDDFVKQRQADVTVSARCALARRFFAPHFIF